MSRETVLKMCWFSLPSGYIRTKPVAKPKLGLLPPVIDSCQRRSKNLPDGGARVGQLGSWYLI